MKVFISWSGERSKAAAELLNEWIPCVIQAVKPWISIVDIEKGTIWFKEITDILKDTSVGIICLTPENKDKPWILFESGALLSGLTEPRVCTFLIDLKPTDIEPPLSQFNHTIHLKTDMLKLLKSLNNQLAEHKLDEKILKKAFDIYWSDFDKQFKEILKIKPAEEIEVKPRTEDSMMKELLLTVRSLEQRLSDKGQDDNNFEYIFQKPSDWSDKNIKMFGTIGLAHKMTKDGYSREHVIAALVQRGFSSSDAKRTYANILQRMSLDVPSQK